MRWIAENEKAMEALGRKIGAELAPGAVLGLVGGLGAGKTCLSKGLVAGVGHLEDVTSPTFSLLQEYLGGRMPVFHFDFYRLEGPEALIGIGWDEILDQKGLVIAEWADLFPEMLPEETRWLSLSIRADGGRVVEELSEAPSGTK